MDIDTLRQAREKLEAELTALVRRFELETTVLVRAVRDESVHVLGRRNPSVLYVRVDLEV